MHIFSIYDMKCVMYDVPDIKGYRHIANDGSVFVHFDGWLVDRDRTQWLRLSYFARCPCCVSDFGGDWWEIGKRSMISLLALKKVVRSQRNDPRTHRFLLPLYYYVNVYVSTCVLLLQNLSFERHL